MDAAIPLWRTGVHALAADHGCKAKATGESSLLCDAFVIVPKNQRVPLLRVALSFGSYRHALPTTRRYSPHVSLYARYFILTPSLPAMRIPALANSPNVPPPAGRQSGPSLNCVRVARSEEHTSEL